MFWCRAKQRPSACVIGYSADHTIPRRTRVTRGMLPFREGRAPRTRMLPPLRKRKVVSVIVVGKANALAFLAVRLVGRIGSRHRNIKLRSFTFLLDLVGFVLTKHVSFRTERGARPMNWAPLTSHHRCLANFITVLAKSRIDLQHQMALCLLRPAQR
jgi:hypothetical protein